MDRRTEYQLSIDLIWLLGWPAVAVGALRACYECVRPIESVTSNRRLCDPCWRKLINKREREQRAEPCIDCGRERWGTRCKECAVKPKMSAVYFLMCPCGKRFAARTTQRRYCGPEHGYEYGVKVAARNAYRTKVGIPLDRPTPRERRASAH